MSLRKAVFLDRDGVLNEAFVREGKPYPPYTLEEFRILPGVPEALALLKSAGYLLIVATNQPDIANGKQTLELLNKMHEKLSAAGEFDEIKACLHADRENCECRKPKPGMLLEAAKKWNIDLAASFMVGDRWRDIEAGKAAGCKTILIRNEYKEKQVAGDWVVDSLLEAARVIVGRDDKA